MRVRLLANLFAGMGVIDEALDAAKEANGKRTNVCRFTFDQSNPFNLSTHHAVDVAYHFGNMDFGT